MFFKALANCESRHIDNYKKMAGTLSLSRYGIFCIENCEFLLSQQNSNYGYRLLRNHKTRDAVA